MTSEGVSEVRQGSSGKRNQAELVPNPRALVDAQVLRSEMGSITEEMALNITRTARSPGIRESLEFITAICSPSGEVLVQSLTLALQLGAMPIVMQSVLEQLDPDDIGADDYVITNDPYAGGTHLPDVFFLKPVREEGELVAWVATEAHHIDVGGRSPGSSAPDSRQYYEEGIRIPPTIVPSDRQNPRALWRVLRANVRQSDVVLADMAAQTAACDRGQKAVGRLARRYGPKRFRKLQDDILGHGEFLMRTEIARLPNGSYEFEDHLDDDGVGGAPARIAVAVTIEDDHVVVDFAGTSPQVPSAVNCPIASTISAAHFGVRAVISNTLPDHSGVQRAIVVKAPLGSIVNPEVPGACSARGVTAFRIVDAVLGALSKALPDRVPAAGEGGMTIVVASGEDDAGKEFLLYDTIHGTWGGRPDHDGTDGVATLFVNAGNTPVEVIESEMPLLVNEYGLVTDSGGHGKYRGGMSLVREYEFRCPVGAVEVRADRTIEGSYGLWGGGSGGLASNVLIRADGALEELPSKVRRMATSRGDRFRHVLGGGGGWGSPGERSEAAVSKDVREGRVSPDEARRVYGYSSD